MYGARQIEIVGVSGESASEYAGLMPKIPNPTNHMRPAAGGSFILPS
jgi:hypothetical protein